ncbi:hypothetical protein ACFWV1_14985 [Streptomyces sp. NPDC058700]|uniref:hypothetical protein n=1 Tax=Streptomyces sp. NPDC058700 TaxID=3346607 RepID=UPI00365DC535
MTPSSLWRGSQWVHTVRTDDQDVHVARRPRLPSSADSCSDHVEIDEALDGGQRRVIVPGSANSSPIEEFSQR